MNYFCISGIVNRAEIMTSWFRKIRERSGRTNAKEDRLFGRIYARKAKNFIDEAMKGLDKEAEETRDMAESFFRLLSHKLRLDNRNDPPTKEEVKEALEQLKDVGRFSIFITSVILPGGVVSLVGLELLSKKFGIRNFTLIPSSFRKRKEKYAGDGKADADQACSN